MVRLVKVVLVVGLLVVLGFELGRPLVTRLQVEGTAQDAADVAGRSLDRRGDQRRAAAEARALVEERGGELEAFTVRRDGRIDVTVVEAVDPLVLDAVEQLEGWYEVRSDATSARIAGG